ncbi:MAG: phosphotransferase [Chitinivibrionales bacterium]|nr:phosphotransferase [Chitinivibrionales bacterium]
MTEEIKTPIYPTPAQKEFLIESFPEINPDSWEYESAGRAASDRYFIRVRHAGESYIMIVWDSHDPDWDRFLALQRDLAIYTDVLPPVNFADEKRGLILEKDCGTQTLKLAAAQSEAALGAAYRQAIGALTRWHAIPLSASEVLMGRRMDEAMFLWESDYFATHCVTEFFGQDKLLGDGWQQERYKIAREAENFPVICLHRDFQSENIMIQDRRVWFVDYQGARGGPAGYDLASLLFDPYNPAFTSATIRELFDYYQSISPAPITNREFMICAAQRLMQALGAFSNLSIHKRKEWYRAFIPRALVRLNDVVSFLGEFKHLGEIVSGCWRLLASGQNISQTN